MPNHPILRKPRYEATDREVYQPTQHTGRKESKRRVKHMLFERADHYPRDKEEIVEQPNE